MATDSQPSMPKHDASGAFQAPIFPDSAPLVRIDLETRKLDTLGFLKIPKITLSVTQTANGGMSMSSITNPMQVVDDWAVMADGSVALTLGWGRTKAGRIGNGRDAANHPGGSGALASKVGSQHDVGIEHGDEALEIASTCGREEGVDHLSLT